METTHDPIPDHTCANDGPPSRECAGCQHIAARFGALFARAIETCVEDSDNGDEGDDAFEAVFYELYDLGLLPPVWFHCATIATHLADEPLTVDRETIWGNVLSADLDPNLPQALDLCDRLLTAAGLGEREQAAQVLRDIGALEVRGKVAIHLTLCAMAHHHMFDKLNVWQLTAHGALMTDVWLAIARPAETLMAARIAGAIAAHDTGQYCQLLYRASLHQILGGVTYMWLNGIAARMPDPDAVALIKMVRGELHSMVNLHVDPSLADDVTDQGFMYVAAAVRAIASRDITAVAKLTESLSADAGQGKAMVGACAAWYAQLLLHMYGESVGNAMRDVSS